MIAHKLRLLSAVLFGLAFIGARAQFDTRRTFDLAVDYGIDCHHDHTLAEHGFTMAQVAARFPAFVSYTRHAGWSDAEVLAVYEIVAAANDAVWRGDMALNYNVPLPDDGCISRSNVIWPHGGYRINHPVLFAHGRHIGQGTGNWTDFSSPCNTMGGTLLQVDHERWLTARAPERHIFLSAYAGRTDANAWTESARIEGFRLEGGRWGLKHDPALHSSGIVMWDAGEASHIEQVMANGFNDYGLELVRGTPNTCHTISTFCNGLAGVGLLGNNGLSTSTFVSLSGDDQPALVRVRPYGPGDVGGGTMVFVGVKSETGKRTPLAAQVVFDGVGAINAVFDGVWAHADGEAVPDAAFVVDFQGSPGQVEVRGARLNGYRSLLHLVSKGQRIHGPGGLVPWSLVVNEQGLVWASRPMTTDPVAAKERLGFVAPGGSFDYGKGLPRFAYTAEAQRASKGAVPTAGHPVVSTSFALHSAREGVNAMLDGDPATRWTSGRAPKATDALELDLGTASGWRRITLDATGSPLDVPNGLVVEVGTDGRNWRALKASDGLRITMGAVSRIELDKVLPVRYVRIRPAGGMDRWWSIHGLTVE